MEQPNYYAIIPAEVRYSDIKANAKLLYGEITALSNKEGYCWATSSYFANLYKVSRISIQKWLGELENAGFIKRNIFYKKNSKEIETRVIYLVNKSLHPSKQKFTPPSKQKFTENITSNNITSNITTKVVTEFDNSDVNMVIEYFLKTLNLPALDGSQKSNRYAAKRLLNKAQGNVDAVIKLIDILANDSFHLQNASSITYLDKHAIAIMQRARQHRGVKIS